MRRPQLRVLTSFRFVAAAMILFHHTKDCLAVNPVWANRVLWDHGVSFFFVLSGFILSYSYPSLSNPGETARFIVARIARLWPMHLLSTLLLFVALPFSSMAVNPFDLSWIIPLNILLVHAWFPFKTIFYSLNSASWSISTEFFFYLCFPILIKNWEQTWLWKLIFAFAILVTMISLGNWFKLPVYSDAQNGITTFGLIYINPGARLFEFVLGMSGILIWRRLGKGKWGTVWRATATELAAIGFTVWWFFKQPLANLLLPFGGFAGLEWLAHCGSCIAFVFLIPIMAQGKGLVSRALSVGIFVGLGEISYSIYLLHQPILWVVGYRFPSALSNLSYGGLFVLWVSIILMAYLTWKFIELPFRQGILRAWDSRTYRQMRRQPAELIYGKTR